MSTIKRYLSNHWQRSLLILLLVFVVLNNLIWYLLGGSPLHWDASTHLSESLEAYRIVTTADIPLQDLLHFSWYYPPFVSWSSIPFYLILGEGLFASSLLMTGFLIVLLLSTYGMGKRLFDENVGLLSVLFVSAFPIVMDFSRQFMLDMPLASMTALSLYLLIRTDKFTSALWSFLLGLALGCGFITKWTFPFFLAYPFLFMCVIIFVNDPGRIRRIGNLMLCLFAACAVSLPWYSIHLINILAGRSSQLVQGNHSLVESISYYLQVLPQQISWLLFFPIVGGIILYVRQYGLKHLVPILSIIGGYVLLTIVNFKMPRFSIPLLPPIAVLACGGILGWVMQGGHLRWKRVRTVSVFSVVVVLQSLVTTYVPNNSAIGKVLSMRILSASIVPVQGPEEHNWQQYGILRTVMDDSLGQSRVSRSLRVIPDHLFFNWQSFDYVVAVNRLTVTVWSAGGFPQPTDYVVLKTGALGEDVTRRQQLTNIIASDTLTFEFVKSFALPDGSRAILLRARQQSKIGNMGNAAEDV